MEQGEEKVSPLRGWGDVPMRDFRTTSRPAMVGKVDRVEKVSVIKYGKGLLRWKGWGE